MHTVSSSGIRPSQRTQEKSALPLVKGRPETLSRLARATLVGLLLLAGVLAMGPQGSAPLAHAAIRALPPLRTPSLDGLRPRLSRFQSGIFFNSISCPTTTTCFAVGSSGTILTTSNGGTTWTSQSSGTSNSLQWINCPTTTICFTVGDLGTILATTNGGTTWGPQTSGTPNTLFGVNCPTTTTCFAVGFFGIILATTNGGANWAPQTSGTTNNLSGVNCPTTTTCFAVGDVGTIRATTDGGTTWGPQTSGTSTALFDISCPTTTTCFAVGDVGTIRATTDGGTTWGPQTSGTPNALLGISCPATTTCFAVGSSGLILATTNGGTTWGPQTSGTPNALLGISCPAPTTCFAVGDVGTILATTDGGAHWTPQTSLALLSRSWYFAEGYSGANFNVYFTVFNPNSIPANLTVTYYKSNGTTKVVGYTVQPNQPLTWFANADVPSSAFGAKISSDQGVMAERSMYFQISSINGNPPATGASDVVGVTAPQTQWYFAEGYTGKGFNEFLTLINPDPTLTAFVSVQYYTQAGTLPLKSLTIPAGQRFTITVNDATNLGAGPNQAVGASITSSIPIVAERPMYFSFPNLNPGPGGPATILGGHDVMGANSLGTTFNFAEGYTGANFNEFLTLINPGASNTTATITYYVQGGSPVTRTLSIPAGTRQTVLVWAPPSASNPAGLGLSSVGVSVNVTTTGAGNSVPILVERPIYFAIPNFNGQLQTLTGGTIAIGSNTLGTTVVFAAGTTQTNYNEFITIENPNSAAANITVTYAVAGGAQFTRSLQVPANSRGTILVYRSDSAGGLGPNVDPLVTTTSTAFPGGVTFPGGVSAVLTSDQPIFAERPEYMLATNVNVGAGGPALLPGGHDAVGVVL